MHRTGANCRLTTTRRRWADPLQMLDSDPVTLGNSQELTLGLAQEGPAIPGCAGRYC